LAVSADHVHAQDVNVHAELPFTRRADVIVVEARFSFRSPPRRLFALLFRSLAPRIRHVAPSSSAAP